MRDVDATLMLGSRAGRIRLTAWCRTWWHAHWHRKDHHG